MGVIPDDRSELPALLAAVALLVAWNVVLNVALPSPLYVPANLAMGGVLLWASTRWSLDRSELGLEPSRVWHGVRLGVAAACVVAAGLLFLMAWPWSRRFFEDGTLTDLAAVGMLYQVLLRIPFGTAVLEELAFRGVLFGLWRRAASIRSAAIGSSVVFGVWHVLPTLGRLDLNPAGGYAVTGLAETAIVLGAVATTTIAGIGFVWLRLRSGSLVAPIVTHALINMTAFTLGWIAAG